MRLFRYLLAAVLLLTAWLLAAGVARAQGGPPDGCITVEVNGDFETDAGWQFAQTTSPGAFVTDVVHSGKQAAFVGIGQDADNEEVDTTVWQEMQLPQADTITLNAWLRTSAGDNNDMRYVVVWDLATDDSTVLLYEPALEQDWTELSLDLTDFAGKNILLVFGVHNDGDGKKAGMWVDDVHVIACGGDVQVTPTPSSTPTMAPTATSAPTNTPLPTDTPTPSPSPTIAALTPTATPSPEATSALDLPTAPPPPTAAPPSPPPVAGGLSNSNALPLLAGIFLSGLIAVVVVAINLRR